jgi:hypothetical protein
LSAGEISLGSLAQAARWKTLKAAKRVLMIVGALTVAVNGLFLLNLPNEVNQMVRARQLGPAGAQELREIATTYGYLLYGSLGLVGALFVVFGFFIRRFPVAVTVTSLVLFSLAAAAIVLLKPASLVQDLVVEAIFILLLIRAVRAARAYQADGRKHAIAEGLIG